METLAQEALRLLSPIPKEDWIVGDFSDGVSKCCGIGHYVRLKSSDPSNFDVKNCEDNDITFRKHTKNFIEEVHDIRCYDVASVNNCPLVNGYTQDNPKDRVIALLEDMVKAGY